mmetsp:Transcript_18100/g.46346  ORF Transcript_18100/g.46346 Transcript_18100/m.46346 type:complete len:213 (+) Transcript_18100:1084-1722(+)
MQRLVVRALDAHPGDVHRAQVELRLRAALVGGCAEVLERLGVGDLHAVPIHMHVAQPVLRGGVSARRAKAKVRERRRVVLQHADALRVHVPDVRVRGRLTVLRRALVVPQRGPRVLRQPARAVKGELAKRELRVRRASLGRVLVVADDVLVVAQRLAACVRGGVGEARLLEEQPASARGLRRGHHALGDRVVVHERALAVLGHVHPVQVPVR